MLSADGFHLSAGRYVLARSRWLPWLVRQLVGPRIPLTRQDVLFFAQPVDDERSGAVALTGRADFNGGDLCCGMPDLEGGGFKMAHDRRAPPMDPGHRNPMPSADAVSAMRADPSVRLPALACAVPCEARACQHEKRIDGDLLVDCHSTAGDALRVDRGSCHRFEHGPEVGRRASEPLMEKLELRGPRFALATKARQRNRAVH